ncbi:MAG: ABC transporter permease subunit [Erysipelotrichaceae bacterium]
MSSCITTDNMIFKRELRTNLISMLIWFLISALLFGMIFILYPYIIDGDNMNMLNNLMEIFPPSILKAFNMDIAGIDSAFGWLKTEGFVFIQLICGCYAANLGGNILLKEENDHTIEYLNQLPLTRRNILLQKYLAGFINIVLLIILLSLSNYICLILSSQIDSLAYWLLAITPLFSALCIYNIIFMISTLFHKTKAMNGIGLGFVFISYILNMISVLSEKAEFFKYLSVFTLADVRNVIVETRLNPLLILISFAISLVTVILSIILYSKKELV